METVPVPLERLEGKYEILEKIKEGGMGAIYKVRHRLLDETRVIKVMRPQLAADDQLTEGEIHMPTRYVASDYTK